ncbi:MAG TPA: hypothetical protein VGC77_06815 [Rhodopseudomonas sp.]|uniref:hypothetical protein n=1 Tax=Rhodopseudomonas sp. TaxID=1078 RepID=UPI002ED8BE6C
MVTDEMVERAARSDYEFDNRGDWDRAARVDRERYLARSRTALTAAIGDTPDTIRNPTTYGFNAAFHRSLQTCQGMEARRALHNFWNDAIGGSQSVLAVYATAIRNAALEEAAKVVERETSGTLTNNIGKILAEDLRAMVKP